MHADNRRVILAAWTPGARERLITLLDDHGLKDLTKVENFADVLALPPNKTAFAVFGSRKDSRRRTSPSSPSRTFWATGWCAQRRKQRSAVDVLTEATSLSVGDLVVHSRPRHRPLRRACRRSRRWALRTIASSLHYAGGDKLFLPVENIELLSRYGADEGERPARPARRRRLAVAQGASLKKRLREIANELIKIAALRAAAGRRPCSCRRRALTTSSSPASPTRRPRIRPPASMRCSAIWRPASRWTGSSAATSASARRKWRLRAAFVAAMNGLQVAVVVPTTLLARQHFRRSPSASRDLPVKHRAGLAHGRRRRSWLTVKAGLKSRRRSISSSARMRCWASRSSSRASVCSSSTRSSTSASTHKERLKKMREDVHVLTLSATPIPRTLQLALTGVRELSLITTPPVDRLAVRTFISPFDPVILKEALAARALPRRPELLRRAAHLRPRRDGRVPARGRSGSRPSRARPAR